MSTFLNNNTFRRFYIPQIRTSIKLGVGIFGSIVLLNYVEQKTHIPSTKLRSSYIYHNMIDRIIIPILRNPYIFSSETAHQIAIYCCQPQYHLSPIYHTSAIEQRCTINTTIEFHHQQQQQQQQQQQETLPNQKVVGKVPVNIRDLNVPHILGLAPGFDTNGTIIPSMIQLGFGYTEIGTITMQPSLHSLGVNSVKENLISYRNQSKKEQNNKMDDDDNHFFYRFLHWLFPIPEYRNSSNIGNGVVGINLGVVVNHENKESDDTIIHNDISNEYTTMIQQLGPYVDYIVINIYNSSPTTNKYEPETLYRILSACVTARNQLHNQSDDDGTVPPLFLKLSPDMYNNNDDNQLIQIVKTCINDIGINGFVIANVPHQPSTNDLIHHHLMESGGGDTLLSSSSSSGQQQRDDDRATNMIRILYKTTNGRIPIIAVGNIHSGHDIYTKLRAGAHLVQLYSHMIYYGPGSISQLRNEFAELLVLHGHRNVNDVIGLDHDDIIWEKRREQLALRERLEKHLYTTTADTVSSSLSPENDDSILASNEDEPDPSSTDSSRMSK